LAATGATSVGVQTWAQRTVFASPAWLRLTNVACLALLVVAVVLAPAFRVYEIGDAAYFSTGIVARESWALVWSNFSGRFGAFLLTAGPAELLLRLGASPGIALAAYSVLFWSLPLSSLGISRLIVPPPERGNLTVAAIFFVAGGLLVYGFPTETWVMASVFWPAFFGVRSLSARQFWLVAPTLLALFVFSHEMMIFGLPLLLCAAGQRGRGRLVEAAALLLVLVVAHICVRAALPPQDPETIHVLSANANWLTDPAKVIPAAVGCTPFWLEVSSAAAFLALYRYSRRMGLPGAGSLALAMFVALALLIWLEASGFTAAYPTHEAHYHARIVLVPVMCAFAVVALVCDFRASDLPTSRRLDGPALFGVVLMLVAVQAAENGRFLSRWMTFRGELRQVVLADREIRSSVALSVLKSPMASPWATPFQSALVAGDVPPHNLVVPLGEAYRPVTCERWRRFSNNLRADGRRLLTRYLCGEAA
jgi:uncharacterized membrane protein YdcZ (DUF606 family)